MSERAFWATLTSLRNTTISAFNKQQLTMAPSQPSILIALLRNDLRVVDQSIFHLAHFDKSVASRVTHVLPVYVFDERQIELGAIQGFTKASNKEARTRIGKFWKCNVHRAKFLHESLVDLRETLEKLGSSLSIFFGQPERAIPALVKAFTSKGVRVEGVWLGRENTSEEIQTQEKLEAALAKMDTTLYLVESRRTMIHPDDLPFRVTSNNMPDIYTGFRQKVEGLREKMVREPLPAPDKFKPLPDAVEVESAPGVYQLPASTPLKDILGQLLAPLQAEQQDMSPERSDIPYKGGLTAGNKRLHDYTTGKDAPIATYKDTRNGLLGTEYSTKFSPWLANGTLSPKVIYQKVEQWEEEHGASKNSYWIKFELLWRDFFSFLIEKHGNAFYHLSGLALPQQEAPTTVKNGTVGSSKPNKNGQQTIDGYWLANDWDKASESDVQKWCYGKTGVPFIDANMRELKESGYMSNRGRQNVASFFTKDMGHQDWRLGAEWFESLLLDYDVTSNYGNWQYQAGVGVDPRSSRQFNIVKQGKDYDPDGAYVAHWLPDLAAVFNKNNAPLGKIQHPWTIPEISNDLRVNESLTVYATPHYEQKSWISHYKRNPKKEDDKKKPGEKKGNPGPGGGKQKREAANANRPTENGPL